MVRVLTTVAPVDPRSTSRRSVRGKKSQSPAGSTAGAGWAPPSKICRDQLYLDPATRAGNETLCPMFLGPPDSGRVPAGTRRGLRSGLARIDYPLSSPTNRGDYRHMDSPADPDVAAERFRRLPEASRRVLSSIGDRGFISEQAAGCGCVKTRDSDLCRSVRFSVAPGQPAVTSAQGSRPAAESLPGALADGPLPVRLAGMIRKLCVIAKVRSPGGGLLACFPGEASESLWRASHDPL